jgi:hypothetical protein
MIAVCGTCCSKDTLVEDFAPAVKLRRQLRAQAAVLGQWLSFGQAGRATNR